MTTGCEAYVRIRAQYRTPAALAGCAEHTPLLLALSGGADSRLLLYLLQSDCVKHGAPLHIAHVHHGIRGDEADRDEQFCRALAEQLALPYHVLHADIPSLAKQKGQGLEVTARQVRYDFFARIMQQHHIPLLVTAHHADDNLETVLLRLCRGSSLTGLCGIAPCRPFVNVEGGHIVRPLLHASKEDIITACGELRLTYVQDSTNSDVSYSRNRLRVQVAPALRALTDHPEQQLLRSCAALREDEALLQDMCASFLSANRTQIGLPTEALCQQPPSIAKRALLTMIMEQTDTPPTATQLDALLALCQKRGRRRTLCLSQGLVACIELGMLTFARRHLPIATDHLGFTAPLCPGRRTYEQPGFTAELYERATCDGSVSKNPQNIYKPFTQASLSFATMTACATDALHWRCRRPGDVLLLRGMHRSLRKLQNECAMPTSLRDRLPLLCDGEGIVWAPFIGVRDSFAATGHDKERYTLTVTIDTQ